MGEKPAEESEEKKQKIAAAMGISDEEYAKDLKQAEASDPKAMAAAMGVSSDEYAKGLKQ